MSCSGQSAQSCPLESWRAAVTAWQSWWDSWKPGRNAINMSCRVPVITLNLSHKPANTGHAAVRSQMQWTPQALPEAAKLNCLGCLVCGEKALSVGSLVLVRAAATAWQPYSSPEHFVTRAPAALIKLRVHPHTRGFLGLCGAGSGAEAHPVPVECGGQRKRWDLQVR